MLTYDVIRSEYQRMLLASSRGFIEASHLTRHGVRAKTRASGDSFDALFGYRLLRSTPSRECRRPTPDESAAID
eukprot:1892966-Alexandrium_andersonii.AAC.1